VIKLDSGHSFVADFVALCTACGTMQFG